MSVTKQKTALLILLVFGSILVTVFGYIRLLISKISFAEVDFSLF